MTNLRECYDRNKKWLFFCVTVTFVWGLIAHGYGFMQNSFSHDALKEFNGAVYGNSWKIGLGRYLVPCYRWIFRTELTLPWMIGVLALLWLGLAVYFVTRIFERESKVFAVLTAGILTANVSVSSTAAAYIHDLDCNMFAVMCAVTAVYLWKHVRGGWALGTVPIAVMLGIYQGYLSVAVVLVLISCILSLLDEGSFRDVFGRGMKAIAMLLAGAAIYYIGMRVVLHFTDVSLKTDDYNTLDQLLVLTPQKIFTLATQAYGDWYQRLVHAFSVYPASVIQSITWVLLAVSVLAVAVGLSSPKIGWPEKILCVCLIILLPVGMDLLYILADGYVHDLMIYAIWLFYLIVLLLADWLVKSWKADGWRIFQKVRLQHRKILQGICCVLVFVILYGNVQAANAMYVKKDQEQDAYLSLMTRVLYRIEDCDLYIPGTTPVVFVGLTDQISESISGFEQYHAITGLWVTDVLNSAERERYRAYFDYVLVNPIVLAENSVWKALQTDSRVVQMPCYPEDGCIELMDNVLVVKLGEMN